MTTLNVMGAISQLTTMAVGVLGLIVFGAAIKLHSRLMAVVGVLIVGGVLWLALSGWLMPAIGGFFKTLFS